MTVNGTVAVSPASRARLNAIVNFVSPSASAIELCSADSETVTGGGATGASSSSTATLAAPAVAETL